MEFIILSYLRKRVINNTTYVYEIQGYRDKNGKVKHKERCLGKLDSDGVLITTKKNIPVQIEKVRKITTKFNLMTLKSK